MSQASQLSTTSADEVTTQLLVTEVVLDLLKGTFNQEGRNEKNTL